MLIAYEPIWQTNDKSNDPRPRAVVAKGVGNVLLSLSTNDFEVQYVDGKAFINLSLVLDNDEVNQLSQALHNHTQAPENSQVKTEIDDVLVCPTCGGTGIF